MTLSEKATLSQDNEFRGRIQMAGLIAAGDLLADSAQPFIVKKYASHVVNNIGGSWLNTMVHQVLANPAITGDSIDGDIQFTVNSNFNKLAEAHYTNI